MPLPIDGSSPILNTLLVLFDVLLLTVLVPDTFHNFLHSYIIKYNKKNSIGSTTNGIISKFNSRNNSVVNESYGIATFIRRK